MAASPAHPRLVCISWRQRQLLCRLRRGGQGPQLADGLHCCPKYCELVVLGTSRSMQVAEHCKLTQALVGLLTPRLFSRGARRVPCLAVAAALSTLHRLSRLTFIWVWKEAELGWGPFQAQGLQNQRLHCNFLETFTGWRRGARLVNITALQCPPRCRKCFFKSMRRSRQKVVKRHDRPSTLHRRPGAPANHCHC
jgi:hypothetical protein